MKLSFFARLLKFSFGGSLKKSSTATIFKEKTNWSINMKFFGVRFYIFQLYSQKFAAINHEYMWRYTRMSEPVTSKVLIRSKNQKIWVEVNIWINMPTSAYDWLLNYSENWWHKYQPHKYFLFSKFTLQRTLNSSF